MGSDIIGIALYSISPRPFRHLGDRIGHILRRLTVVEIDD